SRADQNSLKNQPVMAGFFYDCFLNGEAMGNYGGKTRQMLPSDRQHTMIKYLFHFRNSSIRKIIIPIYLTSSF
ncbi:hypothetical protein, partial [Escherichia coli]|uniref:hypothetical protein n=1 Tax=Escherichia coli TaxID=562 RepID=UPI001BC8522E